MAKDLNVSVLLDFYRDMLTEKQREVIELYYNEDLSLAEISQLSNITRQGVRDSIKRGEAILFDMEERLGLSKRFGEVQVQIDKIIALTQNIGYYNDKRDFSPEIANLTKKILETAKEINI